MGFGSISLPPQVFAAGKSFLASKRKTQQKYVQEEKRIDPQDGKEYTFEEIKAKYEDLPEAKVMEYWETCEVETEETVASSTIQSTKLTDLKAIKKKETLKSFKSQKTTFSEDEEKGKTSFASRLKELCSKLNPKNRGKGGDDGVDLKYGRSSSRVSIGGFDEYSDDGSDYDEGIESEGAASETPMEAEEEQTSEPPFEALSDAGSIDMMDLVHEVHPQILTMPQAELKMEREIKSKLHPMRKFNMSLMRGPEKFRAASMGPRPIPRILVVGGHKTEMLNPKDHPNGTDVGNRNINGVYEKMPGAWNGRPWYRKTVQRMPDKEVDASVGSWAKKLPKVKGYANQFGINAGDFEEPAIAQVGPAKDQIEKFLYFDDRHGQWKIGSTPKETRCFARCSAVDAAVPNRLRNWQVWDCKKGDWYFHPSMYSEIGYQKENLYQPKKAQSKSPAEVPVAVPGAIENPKPLQCIPIELTGSRLDSNMAGKTPGPLNEGPSVPVTGTWVSGGRCPRSSGGLHSYSQYQHA